jgi:hypothetical protein
VVSCAWWRRGPTRGQCQVHLGYMAGRWQSVAWPAGCGGAGSADSAAPGACGPLARLGEHRVRQRDSGGTVSRRLNPGPRGGRPGIWRDREDRFTAPVRCRGSWQGRECGCSTRISEVAISRACPVASVRRSAAAGWRLSGCSAEGEDGRVAAGELDAAGLSWTSWDMIQNLRRADLWGSITVPLALTWSSMRIARIR